MTDQLQLQRVAEAVRNAAARAVSEDIDLLRRRGHTSAASAYENAARRIIALDLEPVLARIGIAPDLDERDAFDAAAKAASFAPARLATGTLLNPIVQRVHAVWRAGVMFGQGEKGGAQ